MMIRSAILGLLACVLVTSVKGDDTAAWTNMWDGITFDGWKVNENKDTRKIEDGKLVCVCERRQPF